MTIQWWKLGRELDRIQQQISAIPDIVLDPWRRRRHDAIRSTLLKITDGTLPAGAKLAIVLLFQPEGLSASTRWTCEHLIAKGYAPLIISNCPLSPPDRETLRAMAWRVVERPNFGYDFGGYRDGIWLIQQAGLAPDQLLILNDSIWFPLHGDDTMIDEMEANAADFVGALMLEPTRRRGELEDKLKPFFGSYFLLVKKAAFMHPAFTSFWANYRMTSNKHKTVRRGERGFSHALFAAGIRADCIYSRRQLDHDLASFDAAVLRDVLPDLVTLDPALEAAIQAAIANYSPSERWKALATSLAMQATEKQNVLMTAPMLSLTRYRVPYIKKQKVPANIKALGVILSRLDAGALPTWHPSIEPELRRVAASRPNRY